MRFCVSQDDRNGFHGGNAVGAFFFGGLLSVIPLIFLPILLVERRQVFEHKGRKVRRCLPVDGDFQFRLALRYLCKPRAIWR